MFIWLSLAISVPFLPFVIAVSLDACRYCSYLPITQVAFNTLLFIGALGLPGLITGLVRNQNAKEVVGKAVGASYLDASHPLAQRVHRLSDQLQLPRPAVGVMPAANACALGRTSEQAAVIIGRPLLNHMSPDELDAIIGHELGHIASGDMNRMQLATGFQLAVDWFFKALGFICGFFMMAAAQSNSRHSGTAQLGAAISKLCVTLAHVTIAIGSTICMYAFSRRREYYADAVGAILTTPETMRRALQKIHRVGDRPLPGESEYRMLMFRGWAGGLFTTHPTLEARIAALDAGDIISRVERRFQRGG